MPLCRRHVFNRAVTMLILVPGNELIRCLATRHQGRDRRLEGAELTASLWSFCGAKSSRQSLDRCTLDSVDYQDAGATHKWCFFFTP